MDAIGRMQAFVAVVDAGGYTAAARSLGRSKALLSKHVRELEDELGARLLNRTSRTLSLTEAGERTLEEAREILGRLSALKDAIEAGSAEPRGRLRISAPRAVGEGALSRTIMEFAVAHPEISLDVRFEDRFVDLVAEGVDAAIRISAMTDSSLIARRLAPFCVGVLAAPSLLAVHGRPEHPSELASLPCVIDTNLRARTNWRFRDPGTDDQFVVPVRGRVDVNSPVAAITAAEAGLGFTRSLHPLARASIEAGRLVPVLETFEMSTLGVFIVYPAREHLPAKTRAFIDHLVAAFKAGLMRA